MQFVAALAAGAVDLAQPSVTKVGGVTEFVKAAEVCAAAGVALEPHCPYFGPGMFASLHLAAAIPGVKQLEWLYVDPDAWLAPFDHLRMGGWMSVPDEPGLGFSPDPAVMKRYRRA